MEQTVNINGMGGETNMLMEQVQTNLEDGQYLMVEEKAITYKDYDGTWATADWQQVWLIDTEAGKMRKVELEEAKALYKHVVGRNDRLYFWHVLRNMRAEKAA